MSTIQDWCPDVEVAVHGDELVIKVDHLPESHSFAAEMAAGEMLIHGATPDGVEDHLLHLPLPSGFATGDLATAQNGEAFEVHMRVPEL
jgi:hypothetical protein